MPPYGAKPGPIQRAESEAILESVHRGGAERAAAVCSRMIGCLRSGIKRRFGKLDPGGHLLPDHVHMAVAAAPKLSGLTGDRLHQK
jgi:hypothetical protein